MTDMPPNMGGDDHPPVPKASRIRPRINPPDPPPGGIEPNPTPLTATLPPNQPQFARKTNLDDPALEDALASLQNQKIITRPPSAGPSGISREVHADQAEPETSGRVTRTASADVSFQEIGQYRLTDPPPGKKSQKDSGDLSKSDGAESDSDSSHDSRLVRLRSSKGYPRVSNSASNTKQGATTPVSHDKPERGDEQPTVVQSSPRSSHTPSTSGVSQTPMTDYDPLSRTPPGPSSTEDWEANQGHHQGVPGHGEDTKKLPEQIQPSPREDTTSSSSAGEQVRVPASTPVSASPRLASIAEEPNSAPPLASPHRSTPKRMRRIGYRLLCCGPCAQHQTFLAEDGARPPPQNDDRSESLPYHIPTEQTSLNSGWTSSRPLTQTNSTTSRSNRPTSPPVAAKFLPFSLVGAGSGSSNTPERPAAGQSMTVHAGTSSQLQPSDQASPTEDNTSPGFGGGPSAQSKHEGVTPSNDPGAAKGYDTPVPSTPKPSYPPQSPGSPRVGRSPQSAGRPESSINPSPRGSHSSHSSNSHTRSHTWTRFMQCLHVHMLYDQEQARLQSQFESVVPQSPVPFGPAWNTRPAGTASPPVEAPLAVPPVTTTAPPSSSVAASAVPSPTLEPSPRPQPPAGPISAAMERERPSQAYLPRLIARPLRAVIGHTRGGSEQSRGTPSDHGTETSDARGPLRRAMDSTSCKRFGSHPVDTMSRGRRGKRPTTAPSNLGGDEEQPYPENEPEQESRGSPEEGGSNEPTSSPAADPRDPAIPEAVTRTSPATKDRPLSATNDEVQEPTATTSPEAQPSYTIGPRPFSDPGERTTTKPSSRETVVTSSFEASPGQDLHTVQPATSDPSSVPLPGLTTGEITSALAPEPRTTASAVQSGPSRGETGGDDNTTTTVSPPITSLHPGASSTPSESFEAQAALSFSVSTTDSGTVRAPESQAGSSLMTTHAAGAPTYETAEHTDPPARHQTEASDKQKKRNSIAPSLEPLRIPRSADERPNEPDPETTASLRPPPRPRPLSMPSGGTNTESTSSDRPTSGSPGTTMAAAEQPQGVLSALVALFTPSSAVMETGDSHESHNTFGEGSSLLPISTDAAPLAARSTGPGPSPEIGVGSSWQGSPRTGAGTPSSINFMTTPELSMAPTLRPVTPPTGHVSTISIPSAGLVPTGNISRNSFEPPSTPSDVPSGVTSQRSSNPGSAEISGRALDVEGGSSGEGVQSEQLNVIAKEPKSSGISDGDPPARPDDSPTLSEEHASTGTSDPNLSPLSTTFSGSGSTITPRTSTYGQAQQQSSAHIEHGFASSGATGGWDVNIVTPPTGSTSSVASPFTLEQDPTLYEGHDLTPLPETEVSVFDPPSPIIVSNKYAPSLTDVSEVTEPLPTPFSSPHLDDPLFSHAVPVPTAPSRTTDPQGSRTTAAEAGPITSDTAESTGLDGPRPVTRRGSLHAGITSGTTKRSPPAFGYQEASDDITLDQALKARDLIPEPSKGEGSSRGEAQTELESRTINESVGEVTEGEIRPPEGPPSEWRIGGVHFLDLLVRESGTQSDRELIAMFAEAERRLRSRSRRDTESASMPLQTGEPSPDTGEIGMQSPLSDPHAISPTEAAVAPATTTATDSPPPHVELSTASSKVVPVSAEQSREREGGTVPTSEQPEEHDRGNVSQSSTSSRRRSSGYWDKLKRRVSK